jgi:hypothetical protein
MKRIIFVGFFLCSLFFNNNSFAKEISLGETRCANLSSSQKQLCVHFKELQGRTCVVSIESVQEDGKIFLEELRFDQHREERNMLIEETQINVFYIPKGLLVFFNGKEL